MTIRALAHAHARFQFTTTTTYNEDGTVITQLGIYNIFIWLFLQTFFNRLLLATDLLSTS